MTSQPRPVWLTEDHADELVIIAEHLSYAGYPESAAIIRARLDDWKAAPADAAEAVRDALAPLSSLDRIDDRGKTDLATSSTRAALLALGYPHTEQA